MYAQIEIQHWEPLPKSYVFVRKGNQYCTLNWLVEIIYRS